MPNLQKQAAQFESRIEHRWASRRARPAAAAGVGLGLGLVLALVLALILAMAAGSALAQYKVVANDGSVTYTDRPPADATSRVTSLGRNGAAPALPDNGLPVELRVVANRYPVVLYTAADCAPCDSGRRLLQQRGVPYAERSIGSEDDARALERVVGARTVPALMVGSQPARGFSETDWVAYLDAAGYPSASRLPRNWPATVATPMVERVTPAPRPAVAAAPPEPRAPEPPASGIRF